MDRNREARRASMAAASTTNGLSRRRQRSGSLRDSPSEEGGQVDLQETGRLRDRGTVKKDRDRDRSSRSKGRRGVGDGDCDDESTEESANDDEDEDDDGDDDDDGTGSGNFRTFPPNPSSSISNQLHRKSLFEPAKVYRAPSAWKATADEMIGVSVPRKARSASTKRSHEFWISGGHYGGGEQVFRLDSPSSPVRASLVAAPPSSSPTPTSPPLPSSIASARKKMKPNGAKHRPPKRPSNQDEIEIEFEIAEVLYGLRQNQDLQSKQEANDSAKFDSSRPLVDAKSSVPSQISNSHSSQQPPQPSSIVVVAPKRKKPRPVRYEEENPLFKAEINQPLKTEVSSANSGSVDENGGVSHSLANYTVTPSAPPPPESVKPEPSIEETDSKDEVMAEEISSLRLEDNVSVDAVIATTKAYSTISMTENQREEKFQIDLMAPPQLRSSPESERLIDFVSVDPKPSVSDVKAKEEEEHEIGVTMEPEEQKEKKTVAEEADSQKSLVNSEKIVDLKLDSEKHGRDKLHQHVLKATIDEPITEKTAQSSSSLPLPPMSVSSWTGGFSPMGYMGPLQGVLSMDVNNPIPSMAIQPPPSIFSQPRPNRCTTHCYIAQNICYHQQFMRINSCWPLASASGSTSIFGKPCNLNAVATTESQANVPEKNLNSAQNSNGQGLMIFTGQSGKDKGSQVANVSDAAQRKQQIVLQPTLPSGGAPSNILHGPAFIFPLNQQHAAAAAAAAATSSARLGAVKSSTAPLATTSTTVANSSTVSSAPATTMSFSYPNLAPNETQYLAILQNNTYPFPIPAHVGGQPPLPYSGTHPQPMPFFNGSFYSSQMLHPSQLQHLQPQQLSSQPLPKQQVHQNTSISSGSSSPQKNLQNHQQQQQRARASGNLQQAFPAPKNLPLQQQHHNQHPASLHHAHQHDTETGGKDSPSTADSRRSRAAMSVYGHNFAVPIHPQNFALMMPPPPPSSGGGDKKKGGVEPLPSQAFAMSFASINGAATAPGTDISSVAKNHTILQSMPEHSRHNYQIMAAAAAAQAAEQRTNIHASEEVKPRAGDSSSSLKVKEERKPMGEGLASATLGQSIAFPIPDLTEASVVDNSAQTVNLSSSVPSRGCGSMMPSALSAVNVSNSQLQHQHQQMLLLQKQQYAAAAASAAGAARSKTQATSNGTVYSEHHLPSSSLAAKYPNALSSFPQNLVHCNSSPSQSPQWKNVPRTSATQAASSLSLTSSSASSLKNVPQQQQVRTTQQSHTQISFGGSSRSSTMSQGQQPPPSSNNQSPSSPMMVGSPTTSISKGGASGSPRTAVVASSGGKAGHASTFSSQQGKNLPSLPNRKSSPIGGRNAQSILGTGIKSPLQHQPVQQQITKQTLQQAQLFFSNPYAAQAQAQAPHSSNATSTALATGYYTQRWRPEQQNQNQLQESLMTVSAGMLSLCPPVTVSGTTSTSDIAKAAGSNMKGGRILPSQGIFHAVQFAAAAQSSSGNPPPIVPPGFSYVQSIPQVVQLKPAEEKQPAV